MTDVPVLTSPLLASLTGVRHAFFTRQGGVSTGVYDSLNVGRGSRDDPASVAENRGRAAAVFGAEAASLATCYQIHSATAVTAEAPWGETQAPQADAVATRTAGIVCGALAADCAPILLADPVAGVVAAAHAGWKGALTGVIEAALAAMADLGASPVRTIAAVGPCIGPASYEVGLEFLERFEAADWTNTRFFTVGATADKRLFDLPAYVLARLNAAGVTRAEWIGHDTLADEARFFSNRRAVHRGDPDYGRLLSAITLVG